MYATTKELKIKAFRINTPNIEQAMNPYLPKVRSNGANLMKFLGKIIERM